LKKPLLCVPLLAAVFSLHAFDLWQYPEMAGENTVFIGGFAAALTKEGFTVPLPEFHLDYLLPLGLPVSAGAYFLTPDPNLKSFGVRAAYHFNLDDENTDLYFLYVFDFGFIRSEILLRYGDEAQEKRYYDFRAGVRRRFGRFVCLCIETGFKLQSVRFGVSIKLN
jgi:hypothetical protein